jgi:hypothetical protein
MTISPETLAQLRAINDARMPGIWAYNDSKGEFQDKNADPVIYGYTDYYTKEPSVEATEPSVEATDENIAFITAVSANFGSLLNEVEALRARVAELEAALAAAQPPPAIDPLHAD